MRLHRNKFSLEGMHRNRNIYLQSPCLAVFYSILARNVLNMAYRLQLYH